MTYEQVRDHLRKSYDAGSRFVDFEGGEVTIWTDGAGGYHEEVRGKGTFAKLEKNIAECGHKHLSVNMVVNTLNYTDVDNTIGYAKNNPAIECISINIRSQTYEDQ